MTEEGSDFFAYRYTKGIVRPPGPEMTRALSTGGTAARIAVETALAQHARYTRILADLGIDLVRLPADPGFPDGCFVEDTCVMLPGIAVITNPGAPSRRGEVESVSGTVSRFAGIRHIEEGTLDGGDILRLGRTYIIGLSGRTDMRGARQLARIVQEHGAEAKIVEVPFGLHLKSAVTPIAPDAVLGLAAFLKDPIFDGIKKVTVPETEASAACVVAVNGSVILADGFPETKDALTRAGYPVIVCDISEFAKADGGLTCLSVLW